MNPKFLKIAALLIILSCIAASCKPDDALKNDYPKEISYMEYSLTETLCQWENLPYNDKVMVINSKEDLEKYISCADSCYPEIDFSHIYKQVSIL